MKNLFSLCVFLLIVLLSSVSISKDKDTKWIQSGLSVLEVRNEFLGYEWYAHMKSTISSKNGEKIVLNISELSPNKITGDKLALFRHDLTPQLSFLVKENGEVLMASGGTISLKRLEGESDNLRYEVIFNIDFSDRDSVKKLRDGLSVTPKITENHKGKLIIKTKLKCVSKKQDDSASYESSIGTQSTPSFCLNASGF